MFNFFLKIRLKAINNSALILNANPFSGPYSLNQIEKARKNREINQKWFVRNYFKMKKTLTKPVFEKLVDDLGFNSLDLYKIEQAYKNQ
jgi:hypothetical protein